jgi:hypothetical protein
VITIFTTYFNIKNPCIILPTECIHGFHMILRMHRNYFPKQISLAGLCYGGCVFWNWTFKCYINEFQTSKSIVIHLIVSRPEWKFWILFTFRKLSVLSENHIPQHGWVAFQQGSSLPLLEPLSWQDSGYQPKDSR